MSDEESRLLRVVVADDDTFTLSLVSGGLAAKGFSVTTATTVTDALDAVRTGGSARGHQRLELRHDRYGC